MTLGERVKYYRKLANRSQEEVGNHLGIGKSSVSEWESGKRPIPIDVVEQLSCFLEVSVPTLMGWDLDSCEGSHRSNLSSAALDLARKYDQLNEYSKKVVTALVDLELKRPDSRFESAQDALNSVIRSQEEAETGARRQASSKG